MSSEKRLVLTLVLTLGSVYGIQFLMEKTGLLPPPQPPQVAKVAPIVARPKALPEPRKAGAKAELPENPFAPTEAPVAAKPAPNGPTLARPGELVLGSDQDDDPAAYHLKLELDQRGAAVASATSASFEAEFDRAAKGPGKRVPLKLIGDAPRSDAPGSLALTLSSAARLVPEDADGEPVVAGRPEAWLDLATWEVLREKDDAPAVRPISKLVGSRKIKVEGQELAFRTTSVEPPVTVTKVYRIYKGEDGFEVDLRFVAPSTGARDAKFSYRIFGPHGIPIEGAWYTSTFRDVFFGQDKGGSTDIFTKSSYDVVKYDKDPSYRVSQLPLRFAGVEDQYFATFLEPDPTPTPEARWDMDAGPVVFHLDKETPQQSDVGVEVVSRPILVGPNLGEVKHTYKVFAGPKTSEALRPYLAEELASYRKQYIPIPGASWLAKNVIAPLLDRIYIVTQAGARSLGWKNGNYGIAIILLTMTVRLIMFPLGRKQAMMAKKMQDLQPVLAEVKEKYKDDKEALTRETMAVWKRHKVNPAAGCVPALIQMPIFVGLWQALNNSVALRHSTFLYIRDLAAPDMMFRFPVPLPFLGDYFNLLPFLVVSLMLVQTKLFAPPPTTPEAEMNQKMMKYMMIFMAFMFYKVPSGLGLYFITSSTWQIGERLLLPKIIHKAPEVDGGPDDKDKGKGKDRGQGPGGGGPGPGNHGAGPSGKAQGWIKRRMEEILDEASKDKTIRNTDRDRERDRDRARPKPRPGKRR